MSACVLDEHRQTIIMDEMLTPFCRLRPKMYIDGDQWCALYGENLQDGVAGFGATPAGAEAAFNYAWANSRAKSLHAGGE